jgi:hypothetical protein
MHSLNHREYHHVLCRGELTPQYIELRDHSHNLSYLVNLLGNVEAAYLGGALSWLGDASKHGKQSGFTGSIVTQKTQKLTIGDFKVNSSDRMDVFI